MHSPLSVIFLTLSRSENCNLASIQYIQYVPSPRTRSTRHVSKTIWQFSWNHFLRKKLLAHYFFGLKLKWKALSLLVKRKSLCFPFSLRLYPPIRLTPTFKSLFPFVDFLRLRSSVTGKLPKKWPNVPKKTITYAVFFLLQNREGVAESIKLYFLFREILAHKLFFEWQNFLPIRSHCFGLRFDILNVLFFFFFAGFLSHGLWLCWMRRPCCCPATKKSRRI
jgi:hypothetical protein